LIWNFEIDKNNNLILFLGDDENIRKLKYYTFAFYLNNQLCHFNRDSSTFNRVILNDLISIKT